MYDFHIGNAHSMYNVAAINITVDITVSYHVHAIQFVNDSVSLEAVFQRFNVSIENVK